MLEHALVLEYVFECCASGFGENRPSADCTVCTSEVDCC